MATNVVLVLLGVVGIRFFDILRLFHFSTDRHYTSRTD